MSEKEVDTGLESMVVVPRNQFPPTDIDPAPVGMFADTAPVFRVTSPGGDGEVVIRVLSHKDSAPLARLLSLLDGFGLAIADIRSSIAGPSGEARIRDFVLDDATGQLTSVASCGAAVEDALQAGWSGEDEVDGFSRLVVRADLLRQEAGMLRTYARYLHQTGYPIGPGRIAECLVNNPESARALVDYFHVRFDPLRSEGRDAAMAKAEVALDECAATALTNDDTRVLRRLAAAMKATVRVSYFRKAKDGRRQPCLALKIASSQLDGLPLPRPMFEIFVSGARMEGIHLRGGRVARGGLRWSDRAQDFRTEVLGLLKAQMVKNVVIVPEGSKGGFVVRRQALLAPEAVRNEAIACYRMFVGALLDLTDNLADGVIVPPADVVRHDADDPYLVVAADKGTATFSDIANEEAVRRGFWLGDAFASGGSAGYDHKAMGITARGAWESVRRHSDELGIDLEAGSITAVGVGDMSGDVFGNGMLRSNRIRLLAAFDHRHIFVDPDPDPLVSYVERKRLFGLHGSSWMDYSAQALSPGGGIFSRSARSITVSEAVRVRLRLDTCEIAPEDLIRAILRAEVDLLWLGGIGTYVKGSRESQESAGDRANDAVRVDGCELRCRMVGEGANLGFTQAGRTEYAVAGGRINTDAIDNAGGVNCSDHEVNIKILLNRVEATGRLDRAARNALLRDMTDDVAELVLADNRMQALALSLAVARSPQTLARHVRLIRRFEREGQLNRAVAGLPDEETLSERAARGLGLCRPELAVLLAHTKISLYAEIIKSDLPDDPLFEADLLRYFPLAMQERFREEILAHPLRREIIATVVVNSMVNRIGSGVVNEIQDRTGASDADVARAYAVARDLSGANDIWDAMAGAGGPVDAATRIEVLAQTRDAVEEMTCWLLRNVKSPLSVSEAVGRFLPAIKRFRDLLDEAAQDDHGYQSDRFDACRDIRGHIAALPRLATALDIVQIAEATKVEFDFVCRYLFATDERLGVTRLLVHLNQVRSHNALEIRVLAGVREDVSVVLRDFVGRALLQHPFDAEARMLEMEQRATRFASVVEAYVEQPEPGIMAAVACGQDLRAIAI